MRYRLERALWHLKAGRGGQWVKYAEELGKKRPQCLVLGYISRAVPSALCMCVALNCSCVAKACHKYVGLSGEAIYIF